MPLHTGMRNMGFSGIKTGLVIRTDDPDKKQRIGVWIPEIMPDDGGLDPKYNIDKSKESTFHEESESRPDGDVEYANYFWVESSAKIDAGKDQKYSSGTHWVPQKGTWIPVFFEDEDPQKPRYLPLFGLHTADEVNELTNLNESKEYGTLDDDKKRPNIYAFTFPNGSTFHVDCNEEANTIVMRLDEQYHIRLLHNPDKQEIEILTQKKNRMVLNDKDEHIQITTTKKRDILMDDKNEHITISSPKGRKIIFDDVANKIEFIDPVEMSHKAPEVNISCKNISVQTETGNITASSQFVITANPLILN